MWDDQDDRPTASECKRDAADELLDRVVKETLRDHNEWYFRADEILDRAGPRRRGLFHRIAAELQRLEDMERPSRLNLTMARGLCGSI